MKVDQKKPNQLQLFNPCFLKTLISVQLNEECLEEYTGKGLVKNIYHFSLFKLWSKYLIFCDCLKIFRKISPQKTRKTKTTFFVKLAKKF